MIYKMNGADKIASVALGGGALDGINSEIESIKKDIGSDDSTDESIKARLSKLENGLAWRTSASVSSAAGSVGQLTWDVRENDYMKLYTSYTTGKRFIGGAEWATYNDAWYVPDEVQDDGFTYRWAQAYSTDGAILCAAHIYEGKNIAFAYHNRYGGKEGSNFYFAANFFILALKH